MVGNRLKSGVNYRARAPLRLSFGGGGTELPPYVNRHGGLVLNATLSRYVYATLHAQADDVTFIASDCGLRETLPQASHYSVTGNAKLPLHRAVYNRMVRDYNGGQPLPLCLHTYSDAAVGSGLGTSSTLTVAMVRCFGEAFALNLDEYSLAAIAHDIERTELGLSGGFQDQYAAAFGGFNFMEFRSGGEVIINSLRVRPWILSELEYSLLLYFTGVSRESANIIDEQKAGIANDASVEESMHKIKGLAHSMKDYLLSGKLEQFAAALHETWLLKRSTAKVVSNEAIDRTYEQARKNGAWGGKISGAGGGGFMMLIVDPARRQNVLDNLSNANRNSIFCHFSTEGAVAWQISR